VLLPRGDKDAPGDVEAQPQLIERQPWTAGAAQEETTRRPAGTAPGSTFVVSFPAAE
jgi:hypothetical protein